MSRGTASAAVETALKRIGDDDGRIKAFTTVLAGRARAQARRIDDLHDAGCSLPLRGMTFAVKNLFDIEGVATRAGSRILRDSPPAARDAFAVRQLEAAGAVAVGATNMDEFAYGFVTENAHDGATRNPLDTARSAGGSSGGSAAAVAAGMVDFALGTDTGGSVRVPAAMCGIYGLKPTFGRISRNGAYPLSQSLDHVGIFARSAGTLTSAYDSLQGLDSEDGGQLAKGVEPCNTAMRASDPLRVALLGGWFRKGALPEILSAIERAALALDAVDEVDLPGAEAARAAAFCLTATEGGRLHRDHLATRWADFDQATASRFCAGALAPAEVRATALRVRDEFRKSAEAVFSRFDVLLAPCAPITAPRIGQKTAEIGGETIKIRSHLGAYTQPVSLLGAPAVAAPIALPALGLPTAVQIVAPHWREDLALQAAYRLEQAGLTISDRSDFPATC